MRGARGFITACILVASLPGWCLAQQVQGAANAAGGGVATGGGFQLEATLGQPTAGLSSSVQYQAGVGFWYLLTEPIPTGIDDVPQARFENRLEQNAPNPFNPRTTIRFALAKDEHVELRVFNLAGREVAALLDEMLPTGSHELVFEPRDLASGVYLYRLRTPSFTKTMRMVLVK